MRDFLLEITLSDPSREDDVLSRLFLTGSTGSTSDGATIFAYFDSAADRDAAAELLRDFELRAVERERVDWLALYQQSLEPLAIGERFLVAPDARLLAGTDRLTIIVPQEQAFGTGSHETTALCIEILETLDLGGKRGLDIGAGSGLLAIAMHRLGARRVIAFDNDPDAYGALRDNRIRNAVPDAAMPLFIGGVEALRGGTFDAITMNIIPEVILPLLGDVVARLAADGRLILSGILTVRRDDVVEAAKARGLALESERVRGEWWAGVFSPRSVQVFSTSREIPATVEQVFAAFSHPERLARWWGPAGFTNTFKICEFHNGGRWSYTMHGPNGGNYPNESVFAEIDSPTRVVIEHVSKPRYRLTIILAPSAAGTVVSWSQAFEDSAVASRIEHIVVPANEQNLDRLTAEVLE